MRDQQREHGESDPIRSASGAIIVAPTPAHTTPLKDWRGTAIPLSQVELGQKCYVYGEGVFAHCYEYVGPQKDVRGVEYNLILIGEPELEFACMVNLPLHTVVFINKP